MSRETDWKAVFGAESDPSKIRAVQNALNKLGFANPPLTVDGLVGPKTTAAVLAFQQAKGLSADGIIGPQTEGALGITGGQIAASSSGPTTAAAKHVSIGTVVAALRQAAQEKGFTPSDTLLSLMIGQLRGAEGAYPGVQSSLGGTNNYGAAQVTASLKTLKQAVKGWGAFAHKDSDPNGGSYLGWYWIAPSPLEGARYWLSNWWGNALLQGNPQDAKTYATILYKGRYFGGMHAGDPNHDPSSEAGQANINDYAAAINRGRASAAELSSPADDPSNITVDPSAFQSLDKRGITPDLFTKAKSGGLGSGWNWLLPDSWEALVANKGVVWIGPAIESAETAIAGNAGKIALGIVGVILGFFLLRK